MGDIGVRMRGAVASVWRSPVRWLLLALASGLATALAPTALWAMGWPEVAWFIGLVLWFVVTPTFLLAFAGQVVGALIRRRRRSVP